MVNSSNYMRRLIVSVGACNEKTITYHVDGCGGCNWVTWDGCERVKVVVGKSGWEVVSRLAVKGTVQSVCSW